MTVNRTTLLDLPLPVTGTESGTWGDTTNNGLTQYMDIAIAGMSNLTSANFTAGALTIETTEGTAAGTNITATSAQYAGFRVSSLAVNSTITVGNTGTSPARSYRLINADATYSLTFKATGQTGVTLLPGQSAVVAFNGTDYVIIGVVGAGSTTDNTVPRFDGTTGEILQSSGVTIDDSNNVSGVAQLNATTVDTTNIEVTNIKAKDGTAAATIADSTGVVSITANPVLSGGTANGVLYLDGSKVATSGSALTFDGTTFAVTNASASLALSATKSADGNTAFFRRVGGTYNPGMYISLSDTVNNEIIFNTTYSSGNAPAYVWQAAGSEKMRLDSTGLGIGTSSPGAKLEVSGGASSITSLFKSSSGTATTLTLQQTGVRQWSTYLPASSNNFVIRDDSAAQDRLTLDSSGNLGIGTSSPGSLYTGANNLVVGGGSGNTGLTVFSGTANTGRLFFADGTSGADAYRGWVEYNHTSNYLSFGSDGSERARITSGGGFLVGTTAILNSPNEFKGAQTNGGAGILTVYNSSSSGADDSPPLTIAKAMTTTTSSARFVQFYADATNTAMGGIVGNGANNVQFATLSDRRDKTNITPIVDSLSKVLALNPVEFDWSKSGEHCNAGFVAQDVEEVFPEFVIENFAQEGQEPRKGLTGGMTGGIIPHLVKAIQEQQALIESLTTRVATLEGTQP